MKKLEKVSLTGQANIDKYLITKPDLLEPWPDKTSQLLTYRYLNNHLEPQVYKQVLETNYSENYDSIVDCYIRENTNKNNLRECIKSLLDHIVYQTSVEIVKDFTVSLTKNDIWTKDLVKILMKSPFAKETTQAYIWNLISFTEDKELLQPFTKHPWRDIRLILATSSLFLDQLVHDKSKIVATEAAKRLYRSS